MDEISKYTNSVQHNVIATVIDNLNKKKNLTFYDVTKVGTSENKPVTDTGFKISTLNGMSEILEEIHALGYKIVKGK
jgi:hypothetical protein